MSGFLPGSVATSTRSSRSALITTCRSLSPSISNRDESKRYLIGRLWYLGQQLFVYLLHILLCLKCEVVGLLLVGQDDLQTDLSVSLGLPTSRNSYRLLYTCWMLSIEIFFTGLAVTLYFG